MDWQTTILNRKICCRKWPCSCCKEVTTKQNPLNKRTVQRFCKLYKRELDQNSIEKREIKCFEIPFRGQPFFLSSLNKMVQRCLLATRSKGRLISLAIVIFTVKALIARYSEYNLEHIDLDSSSRAKSLFKRMGFVKRMSATWGS